MSEDKRHNQAVAALTRSDVRRDHFFGADECSDGRLLEIVAGVRMDPEYLAPLAGVSQLLRLIHSFLVGTETGEGFVTKFSERWLRLAEQTTDTQLDVMFDELESFYQEIQMFSGSIRHREEEPLLIDLDRLKTLAQNSYQNIKRFWYEAI